MFILHLREIEKDIWKISKTYKGEMHKKDSKPLSYAIVP